MNRLRELRIENNMNMKQAAQALKMPYTTYVNYEKGLREPSSEVLIEIAKFYSVSIDYLLGHVSEPHFYLDNDRILREINDCGDENKASAETGKRDVTDEDIQFALFGGRDEITESMYDEIKKFAAYLKQREGYNK